MPSGELSPAHAWLGIVCYTLQIYFDFSGYSDMAIGLGRMFGFRFPENFRWPYIADSVQEFWRRWHISLSTWFRDYLYIPLGGNRVSAGAALSQSGDRVFPVRPVARRELELRRSGACGTARFWCSNGSGLAGTRTRALVETDPACATRCVVVMIGWVFFRADTLPAAVAFLKAMAGARAAPHAVHRVVVSDAGAVAGARGRRHRIDADGAGAGKWRDGSSGLDAGRDFVPRLSAIGATALVLLLVASIMQIAARTYNPFIYFRF